MESKEHIDELVELAGFDYAKPLGVWNGFNAYRLLLRDTTRRTGIPVMVVCDQDGECRYCSLEEVFEIYDYFYIKTSSV